MNNLKKIGLSALAGSLVAVSAANAGSLSVSGGAKMSYTADTGNEDAQYDGSRWGLQQAISFSGSGELANGHTVSLLHVIDAGGTTHSSSVLTYDMGDMGTLRYQQASGSLGIGIIDDLTPTAVEEVFDGLDADEHSDGSESLNGRVSGGVTGFNYRNTAMDGLTLDVGYSPKTTSSAPDDGANSGTGALRSTTSVAIQYTGMEGLNIYAGTGDKGTATSEEGHDTYGVKYAWGPLTVGYQHSEIDAAGSSSDLETDSIGISFSVNENLSVSYGEQTTEKAGTTLEQEVSGVSIGYSMGGMSFALHKNKAENIQQSAANESEHTELSVSFAF